MTLFQVFGFNDHISELIIAILVTFIAVILLLAIIVGVLLQKGIIHIRFSKSTRTIFGQPKNGVPTPVEEKPGVPVEEELAPLKITVFDIKEERKKFETSQRAVIKTVKSKKSTSKSVKADSSSTGESGHKNP